MQDIEVWVVVDANGDHASDNTEDGALEAFARDIGGDGARRTIKIKLSVALPTPVELTGTVPAEGGAKLDLFSA